MMMKRKICILLFLLMASSLAFSQQEFSPGSLYSAFGIGELRYYASSRTDQMGIQGISLLGNYVNNLNPAANSYLDYTFVTLGLKSILLKTYNNNSSAEFSDANVTGFNLGIPIWRPYGMTLMFGFNPYSVIQYKITGKTTNNGATYSQTYAGNGGLSRVNFGFSGRPLPALNLGAEANYTFGNIKGISYFDFNNPEIFNSYIKTENELSGWFFKGGAVLDLGEVFKKSPEMYKLTLGFLFQSKFGLKSETDKIYGVIRNINITYDTVHYINKDIEVPETYGFGITKQFGRQVIISTDVLYQRFSSFEPSNLLPADYQDNLRYGIGFEILPSPKTDKKFYEKLTYRAGFSYTTSYFKIQGEKVNEYSGNAGIGIPINNENAVDIGITVGMRGKTEGVLVKDKYIKFNLGLNFGEFWFLRPRDEDK
jgi:hypothetical protein